MVLLPLCLFSMFRVYEFFLVRACCIPENFVRARTHMRSLYKATSSAANILNFFSGDMHIIISIIFQNSKKKKTYRILTAMGFHHWPLFRQKMRKRLLCVHFALYTRNIRTNGFHRLKAVCLSFPTPYRRPFKSIPTI